MKVLIADDHVVVRRGIQQIIRDTFDDLVFGEATNVDEVIDLVREQEWDIAILDISMPGRSGLEALKEIKKINRRLPVLILSIHPEDQFAARALKAGAAGYMNKESAPDELVDAINKALAGDKYVSASLAQQLAEGLTKEHNGFPVHERLSDREYEVLLRIAAGNNLTTIAEELSLSVKTISTYRTRILEKTGMKTNADLIKYAIANRLTE